MFYTVKGIAELTGVTVKTLHHYHKIGLLKPYKISDAGYRLYGMKELERLQQILFYRELDFSLKDIQKALEDETSRVECLIKQQKMLIARRGRMDHLLDTIKMSIDSSMKGEIMDKEAMFQGFNKEEWENALSEQREYIKEKYEHDILENVDIEAKSMNEKAGEAQKFLRFMSDALVNGWKVSDERLQGAISDHLAFLNNHGTSIDPESFCKQTRFFLEDDFHRNMLENMQTGLSCYLCIAAETYAVKIS